MAGSSSGAATKIDQTTRKTVNKIRDAFLSVGVPCESDDTIEYSRWVKLVWNAAFNPMSVIFGGRTTKEIMESKWLAGLAESIMQEVVDVAHKDGYPLAREIIQKNLDETKQMKPYKTSMLLDVERGRSIEREAILGNFIALAHSLDYDVPIAEAFYTLLNRDLNA